MAPHPITVFVCLAAALGVALHLDSLTSLLTFYPDTAQLLRSVPFLLSGQGYLTSVGWYVSQLLAPLPAAQTVWPPGFALLAAAIAAVAGLDATASVMQYVALCSFLLTAALIYACLRHLRVDGTVALLLATAWLCLVPNWLDVVEVRSEPLYSALIMTTLFATLRLARADPPAARWWLIASSLTTAAAILTRYQGIVILPPLFLAVSIASIRSDGLAHLRRKPLLGAVLACIGPCLVFVALLLRNLPLTGSLTGASKVGSTQRTFTQLAQATSWLPPEWKLPVVSIMVLGAALITLLAIAIWARRLAAAARHRASDEGRTTDTAVVFGFAALGCTVLFITALGLESPSYRLDLRYLSNALPAFVVATCALVTPLRSPRLTRRSIRLSLSAVVAVVLGLQGFLVYPRFSSYVDRLPTPGLQRILSHEPSEDGTSLLQAVESGPLSRTVMMSNLAQQLSLLSPATLVGISAPLFNRRNWTEDSIHDLAKIQGVTHLLLFRKRTGSALDFLVKEIDDGRCCSWLTVVHMSPDLVLATVHPQSQKHPQAKPH